MFTQAEIDRFHRDGIIVARGVIQGEELAALRAAADRVVEEGMADTAQTEHRYRANNRGDSNLLPKRKDVGPRPGFPGGDG